MQYRDQVQKLVVVSVAEPAANRHGMLRVEDVARRRIVDDDGLLEIAADLTEVLDIVALVIVAALAEQSMMHNVVYIQLIEERITVLGYGSRKHHHFVQFPNPLQELINTRSFYDIDVVILSLDLDGNREVGLVEYLRTIKMGASPVKRRQNIP